MAPRSIARRSFLRPAGEHGDLGAHRRGDLHTHVPESAEPEDRDLPRRPVLELAGTPAVKRRVGRDARAQRRGGDVEVEAVGDAEDEALVDDDLLRVAALRDRAVDVGRVVRADIAAQAVLFLIGEAFGAFAARVDEATHADAVADLPTR